MTIDERIGQNLAITRGELSQKDLADRMRERGWKWSQATVWSIEKGERPLRLAEAEDVADILNRPISVLLARDGEAVVHDATRAVYDRYHDVLKAMEAYDDARGHLAMALDQIPNVEKDGLFRVSTDWVTQTVDGALEEYRETSIDEFAAFLARMRITQEDYDIAGRRNLWLDRYNRSLRAFREKSDVGQAEA